MKFINAGAINLIKKMLLLLLIKKGNNNLVFNLYFCTRLMRKLYDI